jgi:pimeloyl-ACP methyl ester carboxylesterase
MSRIFEKILPTDRWPNRAISPQPFDVDHGNRKVVVVQPGWGKGPETHARLLLDLTDAGYRAIGLDNRYGYMDQTLGPKARWLQRMKVGDTNPFFDVTDSTQNRYFYRRPTALLQACINLGLQSVKYVGHSEGGRIGLVAATAEESPVSFEQLIIVNGVGTGRAGGVGGMIRANLSTISSSSESDLSFPELSRAAGSSSLHFVSHTRRTLRESQVIKSYDAWLHLTQVSQNIGVTVMNARDDPLINFEDAKASSRKSPEVSFIPTEGGHSNIYGPVVRALIVTELTR